MAKKIISIDGKSGRKAREKQLPYHLTKEYRDRVDRMVKWAREIREQRREARAV